MGAAPTTISIAAEEAAGRGQQKVSVIRLKLKVLHVIIWDLWHSGRLRS